MWFYKFSLFCFPGRKDDRLTDDEGFFVRELVCGDLEVQWGRTLANTTGNVVVRTVAGAEPTAKVTSLTNRDATKVSADTYIKLLDHESSDQ